MQKEKVIDIIQSPDPLLHEASLAVTDVDDHVKEIASELVSILNHLELEGIKIMGVSAIQIREKLQIAAVRRGPAMIVLVNPHIVKHSPGGHWSIEGCLSIGHGRQTYEVFRYNRVKVNALDLFGYKVSYVGVGLFGCVLQHEIDHLAGILISDRLMSGRSIKRTGGTHGDRRR